MRKHGYNPGIRVAQVIGDTLHEINPATAADEAHAAVASSVLKDKLAIPRRIASAHERHSTAHHECGHALAALVGGAADIKVHLREDGSGLCVASAIGDAEARITYALAGSFAEIKFRPAAIHDYICPPSADFLMARIWIDQLNASRAWPQLTYRSASKNAMKFVEDQWLTIQNLALVLNHSGELCISDIRLFAACVRR